MRFEEWMFQEEGAGLKRKISAEWNSTFNEKVRRNAVFLKQTVEEKSGPDITWGKGGLVKNV